MENYKRGDTYILYANFTDRDGSPIDPDLPQGSIYYVNEAVNYPLAEDIPMTKLAKGIYYAAYKIPKDADCGTYLATVRCIINEKPTQGAETFVVGSPNGNAGTNLISVVGVLNDNNNSPLDKVQISATQSNEEIARTNSDPNGQWGLRLAPGDYNLHINREGYLAQLREIKVPSDQSWVNLDTIELKPKTETIDQGDGNRKVTDTVKYRDGGPLLNVRVRAYDINDPDKIIAQDYTDETGRWILYLDPGRYKITFYKYGYQVPDPITWDVD